jgi:hypothetical protein
LLFSLLLKTGRYKLHTEALDLDSDYELDNAPVQSASRVTRRHPVKIPFLTPSVSSSSSSRKTISNNSLKNNKSDPTSPFYSTVVEPQMNLGQHWPPRSATFKKVIQGDNWHPIMTKKTSQVIYTQQQKKKGGQFWTKLLCVLDLSIETNDGVFGRHV